jgi:hypothetical protein
MTPGFSAHRTALNAFASFAVLAALIFAPLSSSHKALAADHRDSPTADAIGEGDLTDIFLFTDPNDSTRAVFVMNVNPFALPGEQTSYAFSPDLLYQFKIDNTGDYVEDLVIQVTFNELGEAQTATVFGPEAPALTGARSVVSVNAPTATGVFDSVFGSTSGVLAFVGLRDDPFVFDFGQFTRIQNGTQDLFRQVGSSFRGRPVRQNGTSGVDNFGGFNVTSIVVSVPKTMIRGASPMVNIWATVSQRVPERHGSNTYTQFERMGQQVFATVFIPKAMRDAKDLGVPANDVANYSSLIPDALTTTDNDGSGNTFAGRANLLTTLGLTSLPNGAPLLLPANTPNTDKNLLREALLPDVLRFNLDLPASNLAIGQFGLQNGRPINYPSTDVAVQLVRQLADVQFPSGIPGGGPIGSRVALNCTAYPQCQDRRVLVVLQGTDWIKPDASVFDFTTVGNDEPFLTTFPYLALPQPLPGEPGTVGFPPQQ